MSITNNRGRKPFCEINITPLTDIFLVLLIIMMVIAPLLDQQGLNLTVPGGPPVKSNKQPKLITVEVSNKDEYSIDKAQISADELVYKIQEISKDKKDGLLIQSSGDASHGAVVRVMDAARNAGVSNVSVSQKD